MAVLSATAPLVQAWHARTIGATDGKEPYVLYAASNLGSLIALLAYPLLHERLAPFVSCYDSALMPSADAVARLAARAPDDAQPPRPSAAQLREVYGWLRERCPIGTELYVLAPRFVPLAVSVAVGVRDPSVERETLARVEAALRDWLRALAPGGADGRGWPLGRAVDPEELRAVAARVDGVTRVPAIALYVPGAGGAWQALAPGAALALLDVDLPELRAVAANSGDTPAVPGAPASGPPADGSAPAPAPVVPDLC